MTLPGRTAAGGGAGEARALPAGPTPAEGPDPACRSRVLADGAEVTTRTGRRLTLLGCLQIGGMGEVYAAADPATGEEFVVKVPAESLAPGAREWFVQREQHFPSACRHPNVVAAIDHGDTDGLPFLVMEFVAGSDLDAWVRGHDTGRPPPWRAVCTLVAQAAAGLAAAHACGIVHRDVKPANLMRGSDGVVRVLDWGLIRLPAGGRRGEDIETDPEAVLGTLDYMAPEQAADPRAATPRSDLYSLGCTAFFLLTARPPFHDAPTAAAKLQAHTATARPSVRRYRRDVPRRIDRVVRRMMAVDPKVRFASAPAVVRALERETATGLSGAARRGAHCTGTFLVRQSVKLLREAKRLALVFLAVAVGYGAWLLVNPQRPPDHLETRAGTLLAVPAGLRDRHPELVPLILGTSAFDDEERGRWLNRLDSMDAGRRNDLYSQLTLLEVAAIRGGVVVPEDLRTRFPQLVDQILTTDALTDDERNRWLSLLYMMGDDQRRRLQEILEEERDALRITAQGERAKRDLGPTLDTAGYIELVNSPKAEDRRVAAFGLGRQRQCSAPEVAVLQRLLNDGDEKVRFFAWLALAEVAPHHLPQPRSGPAR